MFKKWLVRDLVGMQAHLTRTHTAGNAEVVIALQGGSDSRSLLEKIIAGLVEALKPGPEKSGAVLSARQWPKQTSGSV